MSFVDPRCSLTLGRNQGHVTACKCVLEKKSVDLEDVSGTPRPVRDLLAALRFVEAELVSNPMRMGAQGTGPQALHLMVIREVLQAEICARREVENG
jgi:hypothetical protein